MKNIKVKFKEWICDVNKKQYANGQIALTLTNPIDGPIATATVNLEEIGVILSDKETKQGLTFIKTWSENEGILEILLEAKIIEILNLTIDVNGYGSMAVLVKVLI